MYDLQRGAAERAGLDDVRIACVGGGSRNWATTLINDLGQTDTFGGEVALYDVDFESAARNERLGELVNDHPDAVGDWSYEAVEDLGTALSGADFVICSTQDPPAETFEHDLDLPKEYGVYQTVGDTVGPGGAFRSLRAIPQYREIAAGVREHCPDAWVLNLTNPMTVCTRTLYEEYPDINAVGICHEVYHAKRVLADFVGEHFDVEPPSGDDIAVTVTGINHFTWVDEATWNGRDVFDAVDSELAARSPLPGFEPGDMATESYYVDNNEITLDLYDRFGVFPAAGDRHLAEFVPWYLSFDDPSGFHDVPELHRWGIKLTPSTARVDAWPDGEADRQRLLDGEETFEFSDSGEEVVDVVAALLGLGPLKTNLNVPNRGQCPDLQTGAVVETNALVTRDRVEPLVAGRLPRQVRNLVETHVNNQETLVEAGFAGDLDLAFRAFLNDPLVGRLDRESARELFADLVDAERSYLTTYDIDDACVV